MTCFFFSSSWSSSSPPPPPLISARRVAFSLQKRILPQRLQRKSSTTFTTRAFLRNFLAPKKKSKEESDVAFESAEVDVKEIVNLARLAVFPRSSSVHCDFLDSNNNASAKRNEDSDEASTSSMFHQGEFWGNGEHLGTEVRWKLAYANENFIDECVNPHLAYVSGFDAEVNEVWETDFSGYTQTLDLDDREAALLSTWIRSGYWVTKDCFETKGLVEVSYVKDTNENERVVAIKLKDDGLIIANVFLCKETYLPKKVEIKCCGSVETWKYTRWKAYESGAYMFAQTCEIIGSSGSTQRFDVRGYRAKSSSTTFSCPEKRFDSELISIKSINTVAGESSNSSSSSNNNNNNNSSSRCSSSSGNNNKNSKESTYNVEVVKCSSDHVLVRPHINGRDVGPFILDTGASGLVLDQRVADDLNLNTFGEVHVSGVSTKVKCAFRRAKELTIGKLKIEKPVFMQMDASGIVSGCSERVVGIIGFDAFKSSIVDVSSGKDKTVHIYPRGYFDSADWPWQNVSIVSNVPHLKARFSGKGNHQTKLRVFMIDSGAGGADIIFHGRAVESLDLENALLSKNEVRRTSTVRGVSGSGGGSGGAEKCIKATLDWIEFENKGVRIADLSTLLAKGDGFDLSEFGVGMVCANVLNSRRVVYDMPNRRMCLFEEEDDDKNN